MSLTDASVNNSIFRKDNPMILASRRDLTSFIPVRVLYNASGLASGQVLAARTDGVWVPYVNGGASGTGTAVGVLFDSIDVSEFPSTSGNLAARMIVGGELYQAKLVGLDSGAITNLTARSITGADGVQILKF